MTCTRGRNLVVAPSLHKSSRQDPLQHMRNHQAGQQAKPRFHDASPMPAPTRHSAVESENTAHSKSSYRNVPPENINIKTGTQTPRMQ